MTVQLHDYQATVKGEVYAGWSAGHKNVALVLPTGGGKSVVEASIVSDTYASRSPNAVIAHRQELVGQLSSHVARAGVKHRIIAPDAVVSFIVAEHRKEFGKSFVDPSAFTSVSGVDTILARKKELAGWGAQQQYWYMDECHHVLRNNKWGSALELFPNALGLGGTATPERPDGQGLGRHAEGVFDKLVIGPSMRELITMGRLTDYELVLPKTDFSVEHLRIGTTGDYSPKQMREASKASHIVGDVVIQYLIHANGKRGITFATDVKTATEMSDRFNAFGIPSAMVCSDTPAHMRAEYIRRFRDGRLMMLVNVDLFGEGFDVPALEVVIMARPTASLVVYMQQFGRALRVLAGKLFGMVIDLVENYKRFGLPDRPRFWSLDSREKRSKKATDPDDMPVKVCVQCVRGYPAILRKCPYCGYAPVSSGGGRSIEQVDGDLLLLDAATLAALRAAAELESPASLGARVGAVAGSVAGAGAANRQMERFAEKDALAAAIDQWAGFRVAGGEDFPTILRRFYFATHGIDVVSALGLPRAEMEKLRVEIEGWR